MYYDYDDDTPTTFDTTIAWQVEERGSWSKVHETTDHGVTTLCGLIVPVSVADTDSSSSLGRCKRCIDKKHRVPGE